MKINGGKLHNNDDGDIVCAAVVAAAAGQALPALPVHVGALGMVGQAWLAAGAAHVTFAAPVGAKPVSHEKVATLPWKSWLLFSTLPLSGGATSPVHCGFSVAARAGIVRLSGVRTYVFTMLYRTHGGG